jgi:hypothetical protein
MLKHRFFRFTTGAITAVSAAILTSLAVTSASAATTAAASSHPTTAAEIAGQAATAPHGTGVVRIIHRGLAGDCVLIELTDQKLYITGNGVNKPVSLESPGNCFDLYNEFTTPCGGTKVCTGYEYQNGDGHCLFQNGGTIDVGAACQAGHPNEEFYGTLYTSGYGWGVSNVAESSEYMYSSLCETGDNDQVHLTSGVTFAACSNWNFPSG